MSVFSVPPVGDEFQQLNQQVYAALLSAITERRIRPGQRLVLDDLAAQLKVSRTPIRDALAQLAAEGLIQPAGRMGFSVTRLSTRELLELYDVRLMCECFAVEVGVGRVTPALLGELGDVLIKQDGPVNELDPHDRLDHVLKDQAFHRRIVALAENGTLSGLYERTNVHVHALRAGPLPVSPAERIETNNREHSAIIDALRSGSVADAKNAISAHVRSSASRALAAMELDQEASRLASQTGGDRL